MILLSNIPLAMTVAGSMLVKVVAVSDILDPPAP